MTRFRIAGLLGLCLALSDAPAAAQEGAATYVDGTVAFDYAQVPFGPFGGSYAAAGAAFGTPGVDPDTFAASVGGLYAVADDTTSAAAYGALRNPDDTVDLVALMVRAPGGVLAPGTYPVDPAGASCLMVFLDDVVDFAPPASFAPADLAAWAEGADAAHLLVSISGQVTVTAADPTGFAGTFSGVLADETLLVVSVTGGTFDLDGPGVADAASGWGDLKRLYR